MVGLTKVSRPLAFPLLISSKMLSLRKRYIFFATFSLLLFTSFLTITLIHKPPKRLGPIYKPETPGKALPIVDNFPLALNAHSAAELPPIPRWNRPPAPHVAERTPLFIGFTRNWRLLQQVVVSYITAGWPPEDIYVVENTGVMEANKLGQLSLQNPFFLNHTRLHMLGVNVLITPTLFTFAQLQNFYLWTATVEKYPFYFWSHMDLVVLSYESKYREENPDLDLTDPRTNYTDYKSVYDYCLDALHEVLQAKDPETGGPLRWATRFFSYDRLALVNVASFLEVGAWDTQIPFYMTDCDMHARLEMAGFSIEEKPAGLIYDVASSLDDLLVLYRQTKGPNDLKVPKASFHDPNRLEEVLESIAESETEMAKAGLGEREVRDLDVGWEEDHVGSPNFAHLTNVLDRMQGSKGENRRGRNTWQGRQMGGKGDPFYRDSAGFEQAIQMTIEHGRAVFREKWGHRDCDIVAMGLKPDDAWRVKHDWT
jgi:hypothetical protein